ncbi:hypothetical protein HYV22_04460 [Candidatus Gottesmanbacteria bacterium]|nr:hypothetical protein [Candidatus Gottesmanbacteria bacterium]
MADGRLTRSLTILRTQLDDYTTTLKAHYSDIAHLEGECQQLEKIVGDLRWSIAILEERLLTPAGPHPAHEDCLTELEAENAQLRRALEQIATEAEKGIASRDPWGVINRMGDNACRALEGTG